MITPEDLLQIVKTLMIQLSTRYLAKLLIPDAKEERPRKQARASKSSKREKAGQQKD